MSLSSFATVFFEPFFAYVSHTNLSSFMCSFPPETTRYHLVISAFFSTTLSLEYSFLLRPSTSIRPRSSLKSKPLCSPFDCRFLPIEDIDPRILSDFFLSFRPPRFASSLTLQLSFLPLSIRTSQCKPFPLFRILMISSNSRQPNKSLSIPQKHTLIDS